MTSVVENGEIFNIFDYMCGSIKETLRQLGEKVSCDELFYLSLLDRLTGNSDKIRQNKQSTSNLKNEIKQQKAQSQCITDFEIDEMICKRRKVLTANFNNSEELIATSKVIVLLVKIGKIDCLLIDYYQNNRQVLLFEKKNFSTDENYLIKYIIKNTAFCAEYKHVLGVVQGKSTIRLLFEQVDIKIEKVGIDWLFAVKEYVEDIDFARNKLIPMVKNLLNMSCSNCKNCGSRNGVSMSAIGSNYFDNLFHYFRGVNKFGKE